MSFKCAIQLAVTPYHRQQLPILIDVDYPLESIKKLNPFVLPFGLAGTTDHPKNQESTQILL